MNVELLRRIQAHNTEHPEQLDMSDWINELDCGTTACIAGHACLLSGVCADFGVAGKAKRLLGLTGGQTMLLFHAIDWPEQFRKPLEAVRPGAPEYASRVNAFIDHFIETGGAE